MIFAGPVLVRLLHEALMLGILAVKNLISINNKIPASGTEENPFSASFSEYKTSSTDVPASSPVPNTASVSNAAPAPNTVPVSNAAQASVICKNCGARLEPGSLFCGQCGHKNG